MPLNLANEALTLPNGTEFPGTPQALLNLIAQYMAISGQADFSGIAYGPTEPSPDDRDLPWFKTDESGNPIGWFAWNGSAWTAAPLVLPRGTTAQRPSGATEGQAYYDTDIDVSLIFDGATWTTFSGSPGDVKEVKAATLAEALTKNPGWSWDEDSAELYIVGATNGSSGDYVYGNEFGADSVILTAAQSGLPAHTHTVPLRSGYINNTAFPGSSSAPNSTPTVESSSAGPLSAEEAHENRPRSIAYWRLVKD